MGDFLDKYQKNGLLGYLDVEDDLEAVLPGPSEQERNESRLRKVITGEKRPLSHTAKEAGAWTGANVALPLLAAWAKGASLASRGKNGVRLINKLAKPGQTMQQSMKTAEKATERYAKKTAAEAAKKKAETKGLSLFAMLKKATANGTEGIKARAAKRDAKDVKKAIEIISKNPPTNQVGDLINQEAMKTAKKTLGATEAGVRTGSIAANGRHDSGDFKKLKGVEDYDNRIEMGKGRKALQFIKGLVDLDDLNPDIYPMDKVTNVINKLNANTHKWRQVQLNELGDDEKIKLIKDIAKGKYDTEDETLSYELYKAYMDLTNKEEVNK